MKKFFTLLLVTATTLTACKKDSEDLHIVDPDPNSLTGTWKLKETMISPGTAVPWTSVGDAIKMVKFTSDGKFSQYEFLPNVRDYYRFKAADRLEIYDYTSLPHIEMGYYFEGNKLILSGLCFEACLYKFERTNEKFPN